MQRVQYPTNTPAQVGPVTVVLYGGPGTGKSTTAAQVFARLKQVGYNVEIVHEVAKDFTWEQRHVALSHQPYIMGKQTFRMDRLRGKVEGIVTDTSTLFALIYGDKRFASDAFRAWVLDDYRRRKTINVFLTRDPSRAYNPNGRRQSEESAKAMDEKIRALLNENEISHYIVPMGDAAPACIADLAARAMERDRAARDL